MEATKEQVAEYLGAAAIEMADLAEKSDLAALAFLFSMAALEATKQQASLQKDAA